MKRKKRRGRPPKYVLDSEGKPVVGLSYDEWNNVYFNTHFKTEGVPKENFGDDRDEAIFLFRQEEAKKKGEQYQDIERSEVKRSVKMTFNEELVKKPNETEEVFKQRLTEIGTKIREGKLDSVPTPLFKVPNSYIYSRARALILQDIGKARKEMNLPIKLDGTYRTDKSITLDEIGDIYFEKLGKSSKSRHKDNAKVYWNEFKKIVKVKRVSQLDIDSVERYEKWIKTQGKKKKWGNSTINNRLSAVVAVFNQTYKRYKRLKASDKESINEARLLCSFNYRDKPDFDPRPISKEDFLRIFNVADVIYRCVMLCALNFGMKETELVDIQLETRKGRKNPDINLKKGTIAKPRTKTGIIGVAIVWDRTVEAINEMLGHTQNKGEFLFLNHSGNVMLPRNINRWWQRARKKAGVDKDVKFEHIRDASQTIPIDSDPTLLIETKLLLGHSIPGVTNNYLQRRPNMVKRACEVLEDHYFGEKTQ